jgi:peroxiredoxin
VVFVYPWTGRPGLPNPPDWDVIPGAHGSTPEAEGFRDLYPEYRALGAKVSGLSCQDQSHQREFAARLGLPYALLSDRGHLLRRTLALPVFETGGTTYLKRLTLVVRDGRLVRHFYPVHPPDKHAGEVLSWLRAQRPIG